MADAACCRPAVALTAVKSRPRVHQVKNYPSFGSQFGLSNLFSLILRYDHENRQNPP